MNVTPVGPTGGLRLALAGATLTTLVACGSGTTAGSPGCAAPVSSLSRPAAAPGDLVTITGMYFWATCNDTGPSGRQGRAEPTRGIPVVFRQGNVTATVATVDASDSDLYEVVADVVIPQTAVAGPAQLQLGSAQPVPLVIGP